MTERKMIDEIILVVKNAIADNSYIDVDYDCVQIDENRVDHIAEEIAETLCNARYRKVDEGAVVLTKEQNDITKAFIKCLQRRIDELNELHTNRYKQARKETAEKILSEVNDYFRPFDKKSPIFLDLLLTKLEIVAKQFGVEVEE